MSADPQILGFIRDGNRKQMILTGMGVHFECRPFFGADPLADPRDTDAGRNMQISISRTYAAVRGVSIDKSRLIVRFDDCIEWVRFRRGQIAKAEDMRRIIEEHMVPDVVTDVPLDELAARPMEFHNRRMRVAGFVRRGFEDSHLEDGTEDRQGLNASLRRIWVRVVAKREFVDAVGRELPDMAQPFTAHRAGGGLIARTTEAVDAWLWNRRACRRDCETEDDGIDLRPMQGLFGPLILTGIFEYDPRGGYGHLGGFYGVLSVLNAEPPPTERPR